MKQKKRNFFRNKKKKEIQKSPKNGVQQLTLSKTTTKSSKKAYLLVKDLSSDMGFMAHQHSKTIPHRKGSRVDPQLSWTSLGNV